MTMRTIIANRAAASAVTALAALLWTGSAFAQSQAGYECDNNFGACGTPQQSGGGCGCGGGGSILVNNTDLGDTYQYADDYDDDGIEDNFDNCVWDYNPDQADDDGDQIGTGCDNCPSISNAMQENLDGDVLGDLCDADMDGDGVDNAADICATRPDPLQRDSDGDLLGDACDEDMDNDGILNLEDNCALVANPDQLNEDPDLWGDACDDDDDGDGIRNTFDNCLAVANYEQVDADYDNLGDACDADLDGDGLVNDEDNCRAVFNPDQADDDRDLVGENCDDRFCFVVLGDLENCLDPTDPFTIHSPNQVGTTGEEMRLRLFANHTNQALRYTFEIVESPKHSNATIQNPTGAASVSTPYEYHYLADEAVLFTPDMPGEYRIHVTSELAWDDIVTGESKARSEAFLTLTVEGEEQRSGGCSSLPLAAVGTWMLPLLALGVTRRRD